MEESKMGKIKKAQINYDLIISTCKESGILRIDYK